MTETTQELIERLRKEVVTSRGRRSGAVSREAVWRNPQPEYRLALEEHGGREPAAPASEER